MDTLLFVIVYVLSALVMLRLHRRVVRSIDAEYEAELADTVSEGEALIEQALKIGFNEGWKAAWDDIQAHKTRKRRVSTKRMMKQLFNDAAPAPQTPLPPPRDEDEPYWSREEVS